MLNKFIELVLSGAQHAEKAVGSFALTTKLLKVKTEIDYCRKRILLDPSFHDFFLKKLDLKEIIDAESVLSMVEDLGLENLELRNEIPSSILDELRFLTQSKLDAQIIELEMQLAADEKRVSEDGLADIQDELRFLTQSKLDAQIIELKMQLAADEKRVSEDGLADIQGELRFLMQSKLDAQIIELKMQLAADEKRVSEDGLADKVGDFADTLKEGVGKAASYFDKKK